MAKLTQVDWLRARLEGGHVENQITMLTDGAIGNHTGCVARLRKKYADEGLGYDFVKTYMRPVSNSRTGEITYVAEYYIPQYVKKFYLWRHKVKLED